MCVCSFSYTVCKARAPYCHLWPIRIYRKLPNYLKKRHNFRKTVIEYKMCVLIFSTKFFSKFSHSKKNSDRYYYNCT